MGANTITTTFGTATVGACVRNAPTLRSRRFLVYSIFWTLQYIVLFGIAYVFGLNTSMEWLFPKGGGNVIGAATFFSIASVLPALLGIFLFESAMRKLRMIIENDLGLPGQRVESYTYPQVERRFFLSIITNILLAETVLFYVVSCAVISPNQANVSFLLLAKILIGLAVIAMIAALYYVLGRYYLELCRTKQNFLATPPLVDNPFEIILTKGTSVLDASHTEAIAQFDPATMTEDEPVEAKPFPRLWTCILGFYAFASIALFCWAALEPNAPRKMFEQVGIHHYTELTDFVPWSAEKYYRRGNRATRDNPQKALEDFTIAIRLNPKFADAYQRRSSFWQDVRLFDDTGGVTFVDGKVVYVRMPAEELRQRNLELALADINEAIRLQPQDSSSYFFRGMLYEKLGEPDKAAADFERAGVKRAQ